MHKFFLTTALVLTVLCNVSTAAIAAGGAKPQCSVPGSEAVVVKGMTVCVLLITDPTVIAKQIDPATGKPIQYRKDVDPNCDGKPSGHIYEVKTKNPVDGTIGVTGYRCD